MENFEKNLHGRFLFYGENARKWMQKCELLLPEIEKYRIWEKKGFSSVYVYAYKLAGMNQRKVDDVLRVMDRIEDKPELKKVAEEKGFRAVRPVISVVNKENEKFWAEKARGMGINTLETYVKDYKRLTNIDNDQNLRHMTQKEQETIIMQVDPEIADELEKLKGEEDWNKLMKDLLETRKGKVEELKPESKKATSRAIPAKIKKYIHTTTNGTCCFPGCHRKSEVLHHTDRFALSKEHDPGRIRPLCKAHHDLAHSGLIANEKLPPKYWKIRKKADINDPHYSIDKKVIEHKNMKFA